MQGTLSSDGQTPTFRSSKHVHFHAEGTFGGGTLTVQFLDEAGTWRSITNAAFTSAADKVIDCPYAMDLRGNLSGSAGPSIFYSFK